MTEPRCRLYLIGPTPIPPNFHTTLADALQGGDVAALRLDAGTQEDAPFLATLDPIRRIAHANGVAVILHNRPDLAARAACDGAHLDGNLPTTGVRKSLGDLQLGISCGLSRDLAMQAGEAGADYVAFGPCDAPSPDPEDEAIADLIAWWVELMELPAVAEGGITLENCTPLLQAGADFLAVDHAVWAHPTGAKDAVAAFNAAILAHSPHA
jgi:thiamine-phosphate pyrophosphorylase